MVSLRRKTVVLIIILFTQTGCLEWFVNLRPYIITDNTNFRTVSDTLEINDSFYLAKFYGKSSGTSEEYNPTFKVYLFGDFIFKNKTMLFLDNIFVSDSLGRSHQPFVYINNKLIEHNDFLFNPGEKYQMYLEFGSHENEVYLPVKLYINKLLSVDNQEYYSIELVYYTYP